MDRRNPSLQLVGACRGTGNKSLHELDGEVRIVVDVADLVGRGVDPQNLHIWTRNDENEGWTALHSEYDTEEEQLSVWLSHFSELALGEGLNVGVGNTLPSTKPFSVDELTGGAAVSYAVDAPTGLGGMAPAVSLNYSSITSDDQYRANGSSKIKSKAGVAGYGWSVGGSNYIERVPGFNGDNGTVHSNDFLKLRFSMVLNGQAVDVVYQDHRWHTVPEQFWRIQWNNADFTGSNAPNLYDSPGWTITTGDGTVYEFGDNMTQARFNGWNGSFESQPMNATATILTGSNKRMAIRWYLRKVTDPLGNSMTYRYQHEKGAVSGQGCLNTTDNANRYWYTKFVRLHEILYSDVNTSAAVEDYRLRVSFVYDSNRTDTEPERAQCDATVYSAYRLKEIRSQAKVGSNWVDIKRVEVVHANSQSGHPRRMLLTQLRVKGSAGGELHRHIYSYRVDSANLIRLTNAANGLGGSVAYQYGSLDASCSTSGACPGGRDRRYYVHTRSVNDGQGNIFRSEYYYGTNTGSDKEWGAIDEEGRFLGFVRAVITAKNANGQIAKHEDICSYTAGDTIPCTAVNGAAVDRENPDPRRGRVRRRELYNAPGTTPLAVYTWDWRAYRLSNWKSTGSYEGTWNEDTPATETYANFDNKRLLPVAWIRLNSETVTINGAVNKTAYEYLPRHQGNFQYGNVSNTIEYANGVMQRKVHHEYKPNVSKYIVNLPYFEKVFRADNVCAREQRFVYTDGGNHLVAPASPLLKRTMIPLNGCHGGIPGVDDNNWLITTYKHDAYGNVTKELRFGGTASNYDNHWVDISYDSTFHLFPIKRETGGRLSSVKYSETASYYGVGGQSLSSGVWGAMKQVCGADGLCTTQQYDQFGRALLRKDNVSSAQTKWNYLKPGQNGATTYVVTESRAPHCEGNFTRTHYNGLGQAIAVQTAYEGWAGSGSCFFGSGQESHINTKYDASGNAIEQSVPKLVSAGSWKTMGAAFSAGKSVTVYDALARVTRSTAPHGQVTEHIYGNRTHKITAKGRSNESDKVLKWTSIDGLGNLREVRSYNGGTLYGKVVLTHDILGNLTSVKQDDNLGTTTMTYDFAGRKKSINDPDLGSWAYAYDHHNNLKSQTDACGNVVTLSYNHANQVTGKTISKGGCNNTAHNVTNVSYTYGSSGRSKGKLTNLSSQYIPASGGSERQHYKKALLYNADGLLQRETVTIDGAPQSYAASYYYDPYLRHTRTDYPDGQRVYEQNFNAMGLPTELRSNNFGSYNEMIDSASYDEAGRLKHFPTSS